MELVLGVTAITVDRRQDRTGIVEKEVERVPEPIPLAIKQPTVGTNFTEFVIPSWFLTCPSQFPREDLTSVTPPAPIFFLQCKGKIKPATTHPWRPLRSRCPTLHPPAMKAKNISVLLFPRQPCHNTYPWFPLSELHSANRGVSLCNCFSLRHDCLKWENILLLMPKLGLPLASA